MKAIGASSAVSLKETSVIGPAGTSLGISSVRAIALILTLLTGFSGLVYEVVWEKYLATLLGSHSEATAAILAIFLGGLSGRVLRVRPRDANDCLPPRGPPENAITTIRVRFDRSDDRRLGVGISTLV
jgi:hypothetical protein